MNENIQDFQPLKYPISCAACLFVELIYALLKVNLHVVWSKNARKTDKKREKNLFEVNICKLQINSRWLLLFSMFV